MSAPFDQRFVLPASVSPDAAAVLRVIGAALSAMPSGELPATVGGEAAAEDCARGVARSPRTRLSTEVEEGEAGGVPILTVTPEGARVGAAPLVYVHGGGFVAGSARASLLTAAIAAATSGRVVHSIDYTLAPFARWRTILDQVAAAVQAVSAQANGPLGLIGDCAGGCIALAATLLLRDRGASLPAAIVTLSPLVDLAGAGDTNATLAAIDYLDRRKLLPSLVAYADASEWADPLVSPVHADFATGFPPLLTQVGTRETLLSDAVRLHRALRAAGQMSRLELYEGMPHGFQPLLADTPEGRAAWGEIAAFWSEHLP